MRIKTGQGKLLGGITQIEIFEVCVLFQFNTYDHEKQHHKLNVYKLRTAVFRRAAGLLKVFCTA